MAEEYTLLRYGLGGQHSTDEQIRLEKARAEERFSKKSKQAVIDAEMEAALPTPENVEDLTMEQIYQTRRGGRGGSGVLNRMRLAEEFEPAVESETGINTLSGAVIDPLRIGYKGGPLESERESQVMGDYLLGPTKEFLISPELARAYLNKAKEVDASGTPYRYIDPKIEKELRNIAYPTPTMDRSGRTRPTPTWEERTRDLALPLDALDPLGDVVRVGSGLAHVGAGVATDKPKLTQAGIGLSTEGAIGLLFTGGMAAMGTRLATNPEARAAVGEFVSGVSGNKTAIVASKVVLRYPDLFGPAHRQAAEEVLDKVARKESGVAARQAQLEGVTDPTTTQFDEALNPGRPIRSENPMLAPGVKRGEFQSTRQGYDEALSELQEAGIDPMTDTILYRQGALDRLATEGFDTALAAKKAHMKETRHQLNEALERAWEAEHGSVPHKPFHFYDLDDLPDVAESALVEGENIILSDLFAVASTARDDFAEFWGKKMDIDDTVRQLRVVQAADVHGQKLAHANTTSVAARAYGPDYKNNPMFQLKQADYKLTVEPYVFDKYIRESGEIILSGQQHLENIVADSLLDPVTNNIAKRMLNSGILKNVPVVFGGKPNPRSGGYYRPKGGGMVNGIDQGIVVINGGSDAVYNQYSLIHELEHALTVRLIRGQLGPKYVKKAEKMNQDIAALRKHVDRYILEALDRGDEGMALAINRSGLLSGRGLQPDIEPSELAKQLRRGSSGGRPSPWSYGNYDNLEFLSELYGNPEFREVLKMVPIPRQFRGSDLGLESAQPNALQRVLGGISEALGVERKELDSLYHAMDVRGRFGADVVADNPGQGILRDVGQGEYSLRPQ